MTPYSTGATLFGTKPSWIPNELDQQRILSYQLYEEIYWSVPDTFKLTQRGTNDKPIYIPTAKTIINTMNRFTAPDFGVVMTNKTNPDVTSADVQAATMAFSDLFIREEFKSKFQGSKRYGLIRGDWAWHIFADAKKPLGSRITIQDIDPASMFPITDDNDVDKIIGVHLVETITVGSDTRIRRQTYRKVPKSDGTNTITVEEAIYATDDWEGPSAKPLTIIKPVMALPPQITQLPVYHLKNFWEPQNPFGSSEIRGFERLMGAINQSISDEELALALEGLGTYVTDADPPVDDDDNPVPWYLGPGRVVEVRPGSSFNRVTGVGTVGPYIEHNNWLWARMKEAAATPDVAVGVVDVTLAQSGIALALQLSPINAAAGEKNEIIIEKHAQMFYDLLNGWYPAYEQTTFTDVVATPTIGDPVPVDRTAKFAELDTMLAGHVISAAYYRSEARKLGYVFPDDMDSQIAAEQTALAGAADPFAVRTAADVTGGTANGG